MASTSNWLFLQSAYLNVLAEQGVTSPATALPLNEIDGMLSPWVRFMNLGLGWIIVRKLRRCGVLQTSPDGGYYLDEKAAEEFRHSLARWLPW